MTRLKMSCSHPNCTTTMRWSRRKEPGSTALIVVLLLISLTTDWIVEGFLVPSMTTASNFQTTSNYQPRSLFRASVSASSSRLKATKEDENLTEKDTWSRSGEDEKSSSRFGVRKRVRAVLEKAKNRTGILNINSQGGNYGDDNDDSSDLNRLYSLGFDPEPDLNLVFRTSAFSAIAGTTSTSTSSNGSTTPRTNGASANGASSKTNGAYINGSAAPVVAQQQPVEYPKKSTENDRASESSTKKPSKGNEAIPAELDRFQVDALLNSNLPEEPLEPLPFTLPQITPEQRELLAAGERIQEQSKMGREGSGFVVLDVKAPPYAVWECLLDFEAYPENIGTVRSMNMFTNAHLKSSYIAEKPVLPGTGRSTRRYGNASITRAKFVLSKFRLNIAAIHKYRPHPDGHYMVFTLDRACTNAVLQDAKGIWYTQNNPDGRGEEYTRVWLFCQVQVSPMLPSFIVDYAAKRAMPRATTWLRPTVEAAAKEWLKKNDEGK
jgi:hypothetical protein